MNTVLLAALLSLIHASSCTSLRMEVAWTGAVNKVGVIGAGGAGLVAMKELTEQGFDVTAFEMSSHIGGVWRYYPGSIMYNSLRANLPKEIMAFDEANPFSRDISESFVSHSDVQQYLEGYATKYSLYDKVLFNREVVRIDRNELGKWSLLHRDSTKDTVVESWTGDNLSGSADLRESIFDAILVCNGHFSVPYMPQSSIPGLSEAFRGPVYHSVQYDAIKHSLRGQRILIIGAKSSATDMARELSSADSATIVYASDRNYVPAKTSLTSPPLSSNMRLYGAIVSCSTEGTLLFSNGETLSIGEVDVILWCTGYLYDFPFLSSTRTERLIFPESDEAGLSDSRVECIVWKKRVRNLYEHLFLIDEGPEFCSSSPPLPTLAFLGLPFSVVPFPLFSIQAQYVAAIWSRRASLPSLQTQRQWLSDWEIQLKASGTFQEKYHYLGGQLQWDYLHRLVRHVEELHGNGSTEQLFRGPLRKLHLYLDILQAIYEDNVLHRPQYVGAPDTYRERRYRILNVERGLWEVDG